ncbi:hypothetical protein JW906_13725 [bacterium]|nr:hypothetical protein [bacterium]
MKKLALILSILALFLGWNLAAYSQTAPADSSHGRRFVDANGDGYNDLAPDADGDGIPNGQDPDYEATGSQKKYGKNGSGKNFVDEDGDGINDRMQDADGDGIPNGQDPDYASTCDGTGKGAGKKWGQAGGGQRGGEGGSGRGSGGHRNR